MIRTDGPQGEIEKAYKAMMDEYLESVREKMPHAESATPSSRFLFYSGWKRATDQQEPKAK